MLPGDFPPTMVEGYARQQMEADYFDVIVQTHVSCCRVLAKCSQGPTTTLDVRTLPSSPKRVTTDINNRGPIF
ncbi:MAG: hypothetical protein INR62_00925 [Rhodospirillales bacterium]|nr:hypothetical protein [Acetobacter sp.]